MGKFSEKLQEFNRKTNLNIKEEGLLAKIRSAVNYPIHREQKFVEVMTNTFGEIAKAYEAIKCKQNTRIACSEGEVEATALPDESQFLAEYSELFVTGIQEFEPGYRGDYLLGVSKYTAKQELEQMFASYTLQDDVRDQLINYNGYRKDLEKVKSMKYEEGKNNVRRNYLEEGERGKKEFRDLYIRKEVLKAAMKERNIFWRWFSSDGRAMRKYINEAEKTLDAIVFTRGGAKLALDEMKGPAVSAEYKDQMVESINSLIDENKMKYEQIKCKQDLLTTRFISTKGKLEAHMKAAAELEEMFKNGNGKLGPEVKEIFELSLKKLEHTKQAIEQKSALQTSEGAFINSEKELEKKYPGCKFVDIDKVEKECNKEKVEIVPNDSKVEKVEPKKEELSVVKGMQETL